MFQFDKIFLTRTLITHSIASVLCFGDFFVPKEMSACFCNSFNCKSSTSQLQPGSIFISARRDEGEARCAVFSTYLEFPPRNAVNITAHLLDLCCSRSYYWTLPTCGPHGSAAVLDCGDCAGAESDWASKDGRCRWAIIACRRCRSLQSCKWRWRKEAEIVVDGVTL